MIQIHKGGNTLTVTRGAYKNFFKGMGYKPVRETRQPETPEEESTYPDPDSRLLEDPLQSETDFEEGSDSVQNLSEIPLSSMDATQLHEYAEELGLEHEHLRTRKELKALIRQHRE